MKEKAKTKTLDISDLLIETRLFRRYAGSLPGCRVYGKMMLEAWF
jgi:hypothetical protein